MRTLLTVWNLQNRYLCHKGKPIYLILSQFNIVTVFECSIATFLIRFNIISHIRLDPSRLIYHQKVPHYKIIVKGITLCYATYKDMLFFKELFITGTLIQELTTYFGLKYFGYHQVNRSCKNKSIRMCNN